MLAFVATSVWWQPRHSAGGPDIRRSLWQNEWPLVIALEQVGDGCGTTERVYREGRRR
jgi:hypothetical protein